MILIVIALLGMCGILFLRAYILEKDHDDVLRWSEQHRRLLNIVLFPFLIFHTIGSHKITLRVLQLASISVIIGSLIAMLESLSYLYYFVMIVLIYIFAFVIYPFFHQEHDLHEMLDIEKEVNDSVELPCLTSLRKTDKTSPSNEQM